MKTISLSLAQLAVAILTAACAQQSVIETGQAVQPPAAIVAVPDSLPPQSSATLTPSPARTTPKMVPPIVRTKAIAAEPAQPPIEDSKPVSAPTPPVIVADKPQPPITEPLPLPPIAINPRPPVKEALPPIDPSKRAVYLKNLRACLDQMPECNLAMLTVDDYKRIQSPRPAPDANAKSAAYLKNLRFCLDHVMTACNLAILTATDFKRVQAALDIKAHDTAAEAAKMTCVKGYYRKSGTYVQGYCRNAKL